MPTARQWQLQEAKSKLSQLVREAENGPQTITHHGRPSAVVISIADYRQLTRPKKDLATLLRDAPAGFSELEFGRDQDGSSRDVTF